MSKRRLQMPRILFAILCVILLLTSLALDSGTAWSASTYPNRIITWVVPFGAGGGTDRWARILSSAAIDNFGQPMHVRNIPGASGVVGWKHMLDQPADGYTILQGSPTPIISLLLEKKPPIQPNQVKIVGYVSAFRAILLAKPGKSWSNWKGFVKYSKAHPGKLTIAGTNSNLIGAANIFNQAGLKVTLVPYPSTGKAVADFLGGHVMVAAVTTSTAVTLVPDKASGVINTSELPLPHKVAARLRAIPSAKDLGYEGMSFPRWVGVHPKTPEVIANAISNKLGLLLKDKSVKKLIKKVGEEIIYFPKARAQRAFKKMVATMRKVVKLLK